MDTGDADACLAVTWPRPRSMGLGPAAPPGRALAEDDGGADGRRGRGRRRRAGWAASSSADGGFDGFLAGADTPDAILALAESAQTESAWGNRPALERVESEVSEDDTTPLDAARRSPVGSRTPDSPPA